MLTNDHFEDDYDITVKVGEFYASCAYYDFYHHIIKLCQSYNTCLSRTGHSWATSVGNTSQHQTSLGTFLKIVVKNLKWITR